MNLWKEEETWKKHLLDKVLCREEPISKLLQLLGRPKNVVPQSLFIYGVHSTGKTFVTKEVLNTLDYNYAFVDCIQCYLPKLLFGSILTRISDKDKVSPSANCDNMYDFINCLQNCLSTEYFKENAFIIVLDNCERLRDMEKNILPAFLRLGELAKVNVCVILISTIVWEKFLIPNGFSDPIEIFFPQYTKDEILKIISTTHTYSKELTPLYLNYAQLFLSVFFVCCRDLSEVQHMINANFLKHCDSIITGKVNESKIWSTISPFFKTLGSELYLRMLPSIDEKEENAKLPVVCSTKWALSFELPYYSKFFLIAAFLASYSPQKLDKTLFVKHSDPKRKKRKNVGRTQDKVIADLMVGPKPFTAERLLAIFYSIVDGEVNFTANICAQISSLVKLQLLALVDNSLDHQKYKCCVGLDFITTISKTVEFDVLRYVFPTH